MYTIPKEMMVHHIPLHFLYWDIFNNKCSKYRDDHTDLCVCVSVCACVCVVLCTCHSNEILPGLVAFS